MAFMTLLCAYGDGDGGSGSGSGSNTSGNPIPLNPINKNNRPKAPSLQSISCWYDGEHLTISFAISEGWCTLTVEDLDDASVETFSFDSSSSATIWIGEHANASLAISTASGNDYEGVIGS